MPIRPMSFALAAAVLLAGCSSRPRHFAPVLGAAPVDAAAFEQGWRSCRAEVAATTNRKGERMTSAAGGAAAAAGAGVAVGAATTSTYATMGGAMAALGATMFAAPLAALGGAWAVSKVKKAKKERAIKQATADCLAARGFSVADWRVLSRREARALAAAAPAAADAPPRD